MQKRCAAVELEGKERLIGLPDHAQPQLASSFRPRRLLARTVLDAFGTDSEIISLFRTHAFRQCESAVLATPSFTMPAPSTAVYYTVLYASSILLAYPAAAVSAPPIFSSASSRQPARQSGSPFESPPTNPGGTDGGSGGKQIAPRMIYGKAMAGDVQ
ncbi:hypothetical protein B0H12DRAFT_1234778 [Mycena haematopus]|nr:hypothetical protein B0H12DRAFT_1234778 [Mycena haematopus]